MEFPSRAPFLIHIHQTKINYSIVCVQQPFPVLHSSVCDASWEFQGSYYVKCCRMSNRERVRAIQLATSPSTKHTPSLFPLDLQCTLCKRTYLNLLWLPSPRCLLNRIMSAPLEAAPSLTAQRLKIRESDSIMKPFPSFPALKAVSPSFSSHIAVAIDAPRMFACMPNAAKA